MIPTWDLFIIVTFTIILAYSFMIGKERTIKVIIASYIAILTADGIGGLMSQYFIGEAASVRLFPGFDSPTTIVLVKIGFLLFAIVFLVMNGGFQASVAGSSSRVISLVVNGALGALSASLILSAILIYASGSSVLFSDLIMSSSFRAVIYEQSSFAQLLVDNAELIFATPAFLFLLASVFGEDN